MCVISDFMNRDYIFALVLFSNLTVQTNESFTKNLRHGSSGRNKIPHSLSPCYIFHWRVNQGFNDDKVQNNF